MFSNFGRNPHQISTSDFVILSITLALIRFVYQPDTDLDRSSWSKNEKEAAMVPDQEEEDHTDAGPDIDAGTRKRKPTLIQYEIESKTNCWLLVNESLNHFTKQ